MYTHLRVFHHLKLGNNEYRMCMHDVMYIHNHASADYRNPFPPFQAS